MGIKDYVKKKKDQVDKYKQKYQDYQDKRSIAHTKKEANKLQGLKKDRIRAEGAARIRTLKAKEISRIEKAKAQSQPKKVSMFGTGSSSVGSAFDMGFGSSSSSPTPKKKKRSSSSSKKKKPKSSKKKSKPKKRRSSPKKSQSVDKWSMGF